MQNTFVILELLYGALGKIYYFKNQMKILKLKNMITENKKLTIKAQWWI
jgi:hypothetical protein